MNTEVIYESKNTAGKPDRIVLIQPTLHGEIIKVYGSLPKRRVIQTYKNPGLHWEKIRASLESQGFTVEVRKSTRPQSPLKATDPKKYKGMRNLRRAFIRR